MIKTWDVLVVGGGMAGCTAAMAAAGEGASVLLLEQHAVLGGNATRAMVGPWQSFHACTTRDNGKLPRQVIGGIADGFVHDLINLGASPGHIVDPIGFAGSITPVDSEMLKLYLPAKLHGEGITVQLGTPVTAEHLASARQIVDASGSAVAARMLGADLREPDSPQPMSWLFTMRNVDTAAIQDYQHNHPYDFVLHPAFEQVCLRSKHIAVSGFFSLVANACAAGEFSIQRDRLLFFSTPRDGEVLVNTTRIPMDHSDPLAEGLRQVRELVAWLPLRVPGFADAQLARIADVVGERESTRIVGRDILTTADVVAGAAKPDAVARGCFPVDIHKSQSSGLTSSAVGGDGWYDIPLGCLEPARVPNLLCCGRCISADSGGFASVRVLPTAMATGQAAGMIAARRALQKKIDNSACLSGISLV